MADGGRDYYTKLYEFVAGKKPKSTAASREREIGRQMEGKPGKEPTPPPVVKNRRHER